MRVRVSNRFSCSADALWNRIIEPRSLQFVASPLISFKPVDSGALEGEWLVGRDYRLKLYLLHFLPMGRHTIRLESIDREHNVIQSREQGALAPVWDHRISFPESRPGQVDYTDEIEIKAGLLTPVVWAFAQVFYRHRQRRWKKLLQKSDW